MSKPNVVINSDKDTSSVTLIPNVKAKRKYTKPKAVVKAKVVPNVSPKTHSSAAIKEMQQRRNTLLEQADMLQKAIDFLQQQ